MDIADRHSSFFITFLQSSSTMRLQFLLLGVLLGLLVPSCRKGIEAGSPEAVFAQLVKAIAERDIDSYAACWSAESLEREGQMSKLKADPKGWDELQAMFQGRQTLEPEGGKFDSNAVRHKFEVLSPDVPEGRGIGTISMVKENGVWKMYSW